MNAAPVAADMNTAATTVETQGLLKPEVTTVWGLPFARLTTPQTVDWIDALVTDRTPRYLITANLNWVMLSQHSPELDAVNRDAAGIVADGMPIVWRSQTNRLSPPLPERVAGSELIYLIAQRAAMRGWGIYFLGGAPGVAETAAHRLQALYPGMRIAGHESPPFRHLTDDEVREQHRRIRDSHADILLVAFGQPKGERWIHAQYRQLGVPLSIQLGASFDFVAGTAKRAPQVWQKCGLEWAYRMAHDPRRLVPRYSSNIKFLMKTLWQDYCGKPQGPL